MLGHDHGVSQAALAAAGAVAYLPSGLGRVGSLNVATAAALAIYEMRKEGNGMTEASEADSRPAAPPSAARQEQAKQA